MHSRPTVAVLATLLVLLSLSPNSSDGTSPRIEETAASSEEHRQGPSRRRRRPNIVFLVCESTDGRTWRDGYQNGAIPLPNLHKLASSPGGASFNRHYANAPACCPSRASLWSGRHPHRIPHRQGRSGMDVGGAWNNYEGLPLSYADRMDQILEREGGYDVYLSGKRDWSTGGHTLNVRLGSWTKQVRFPYDMNRTGGWRYDYAEVCRSNGTVVGGNVSAHMGDWNTLEQTVDWIRSRARVSASASASDDSKPFFVYQGMNIVHPPYVTNEFWYNKIDPDKVTVPSWPDLEDLHPCDLQSSMLKGCVPSDVERSKVEDYNRRRNVRRIYYAMIAEFDAMVGEYMDAVRDAGLQDETIFIVTSDHGDMQMEHRQTYKMVPYDASSSVPMVIYDPTRSSSSDNPPLTVEEPTQLMDIFPTVLECAGIDPSRFPFVGGRSLLPLLRPVSDDRTERGQRRGWDRSFVVSQYHGMNLAMSWFMAVKVLPSDGHCYKLIRYGTGAEVPSQLFDLTTDPDEMTNLTPDPSYAHVVADLDASLRSVVDYPAVAREVALYDKRSFRWWMGNTTGDWREAVHAKGLRWTKSWDEDPGGAFDALDRWLSRPDDEILPCRYASRWPPLNSVSLRFATDIGAQERPPQIDNSIVAVY